MIYFFLALALANVLSFVYFGITRKDFFSVDYKYKDAHDVGLMLNIIMAVFCILIAAAIATTSRN